MNTYEINQPGLKWLAENKKYIRITTITRSVFAALFFTLALFNKDPKFVTVSVILVVLWAANIIYQHGRKSLLYARVILQVQKDGSETTLTGGSLPASFAKFFKYKSVVSIPNNLVQFEPLTLLPFSIPFESHVYSISVDSQRYFSITVFFDEHLLDQVGWN